jgi:fumarate hydratase class II
MHVATVEEIDRALLPAVAPVRATLDRKAHEFADVVMLGRTHLQDATPVTLGQVISGGWRSSTTPTKYLHQARDALHPLALGGTAVGTGINSPRASASSSPGTSRRRRASRSRRRTTSSRRCPRTTRWSTRARRCARSAASR